MNKIIQKKRNLSNKIKKRFKINCIIFYIISILLEIFCWYYISCFFGVYQNTKNHLLKDFLYGRLLNLIISIFKSVLLSLRKIILKNNIPQFFRSILKFTKNKIFIIIIEICLEILCFCFKVFIQNHK